MFAFYALKSAREASRARGNLRTTLLRDRRSTYWTGTVWTTDAAMKDFMLSGSHRLAMPKLLEWCDEAAIVHWTQENAELPPWREACTRLQLEGRKSKVNHPSAIHTAHQFPEPLVRKTSELHFK
jgi:hypothetical protein